MPTWDERLNRLAALLQVDDNTDDDDHISTISATLDQFRDSQRQRRASSRLIEVDSLAFGNQDLSVLGLLGKGQFGSLHVIKCLLDDGVYVRKTVLKSSAVRFRHQCSPQIERDILLRARETDGRWLPHLLSAFQTPSELVFIMDYEEGGTLEGALEISPLGRLPESNMLWWIPQAVSAIDWCHQVGFAHRDIKPNNFVITTSSHLKLIDFGSAAPLSLPNPDGTQGIARKYCVMPCGTVDYISPEILTWHEDLLVALDLESTIEEDPEAGAYGKEVDWWSLGAMMYEMLCGQAPFFADDIGQTYQRIIGHKRRALNFGSELDLSPNCQNLVRRFLSEPTNRIGRTDTREICDHPWLHNVRWEVLHILPSPPDLIRPDLTYGTIKPVPNFEMEEMDDDTMGVRFSGFFESSAGMSLAESLCQTPAQKQEAQERYSAFIGFTWGPPKDAFDGRHAPIHHTFHLESAGMTPARPSLAQFHHLSDPVPRIASLFTPVRPGRERHATTIPRTNGTARKVRHVSDREALRQMMMHVGQSARKKVLESGKKARSNTVVAFAPIAAFNPEASSSPRPITPLVVDTRSHLTESVTSGSSAPPSPSPRPGSAMSRRSGTPALTTFRSGASLTPLTARSRSRDPMDDHTGQSTNFTQDFAKEVDMSGSETDDGQRYRSPVHEDAEREEQPLPSPKVDFQLAASGLMSDSKFDDLQRRIERLRVGIERVELAVTTLKLEIEI